jgi:tetratricopeptide (TPR) repeat protein
MAAPEAKMTPKADLPVEITDRATLKADTATVDALLAAAHSSGYNVIRDRAGDLDALLSRAPRPFENAVTAGATTYVRSVSSLECIWAIYAQIQTPGGATTNVRCVGNPYAGAALLLGSYYNEIRRHDLALEYLDRGLAFAPTVAGLYAEKAAAFIQMHRPADALTVYRQGLALVVLDPLERGLLLRGQGFALTELRRYDEAEAAYRESLTIDPDHGHATAELVYIRRMRMGAPSTAIEQTSGLPPAPPN